MVGAFLLFTIFLMVYITISDIITVMFRLTGLTEEKARFQVISLLTNSGFTTAESEIVVHSKISRNIAKATMVFGYAFTVTIVSSTVNIFLSLNKSELYLLLIYMPLIILAFVGFYFLRKIPKIKTIFDDTIEKFANKYLFGNNSNPVVIIDDFGEMVVAKVFLNKVPYMLKNIPLEKSYLRHKYDVSVMMVKTLDGRSFQPNATTILVEKEVIMVLGRKKDIREVFENVNPQGK